MGLTIDSQAASLIGGLFMGSVFGLALGFDAMVRRVALVSTGILLIAFLFLQGPGYMDDSLSGPIGRFFERSSFAIGTIVGLVVTASLGTRGPRPPAGGGNGNHE